MIVIFIVNHTNQHIKFLKSFEQPINTYTLDWDYLIKSAHSFSSITEAKDLKDRLGRFPRYSNLKLHVGRFEIIDFEEVAVNDKRIITV